MQIPDVHGTHPEQGWRRLLTGINIVRRRPVLARSLATMCVFSVFCLVYVGLFPSVVRRNVGIDVDSSGYRLLYTTWGVGACLGALAVGTVLAHADLRRLVVDGLLLFAVSLGAFALVRSLTPAFPVAFILGFSYFLPATSLITIFQENMPDSERASRDAAVVHGLRRLGSDRQPAVRSGDRRHRRPLGARARCRRCRGAGPLGRSPPASRRPRSSTRRKAAATCSSRATRDALTSTTTPGTTGPTGRDRIVDRFDAVAIGADGDHSMPSSLARPATSRCAGSGSSSSAISPSTATRRSAAIAATASSAARIDVGLAL